MAIGSFIQKQIGKKEEGINSEHKQFFLFW